MMFTLFGAERLTGDNGRTRTVHDQRAWNHAEGTYSRDHDVTGPGGRTRSVDVDAERTAPGFWTDQEQRGQVGMNMNVPLNRCKRAAAVNEALFRVSRLQAEYAQQASAVREEVSNAAWRFVPAVFQTTAYSAANSLNQYVNVAVGANPAATMAYDANGNLTGDGTWTFAYDAENRLKTANKSGTSASYSYDPLGRRQAKTVDTVVLAFEIG